MKSRARLAKDWLFWLSIVSTGGDFITTKPKFLVNMPTSIAITSAKICDSNNQPPINSPSTVDSPNECSFRNQISLFRRPRQIG